MERAQGPKIAIEPMAEQGLLDAVAGGGGTVVPPEEADAVVWTNPRDPDGLRELLTKSPATWVQLPFAGIESFFDAGVITSNHTWTCTKGVYGHSCAEHALTLMLAGARCLNLHA